MIPFKKYRFYLYLLSLLYSIFFFYLSVAIVLSDDNDEILINADKIEVNDDGEKITASGNVNISTDKILSSSDNFVYQKSNERIISSGNIIVKDNIGYYYYFNNFLACDVNWEFFKKLEYGFYMFFNRDNTEYL